jgi:hypothetical protein
MEKGDQWRVTLRRFKKKQVKERLETFLKKGAFQQYFMISQ